MRNTRIYESPQEIYEYIRITSNENIRITSNSHQTSSLKKVFLEISQNSQEGAACNFIKKETLTQVFFCEFCKISKNTFFTEHLWWLCLHLRFVFYLTDQILKINVYVFCKSLDFVKCAKSRKKSVYSTNLIYYNYAF